jgi:hypothetical protein
MNIRPLLLPMLFMAGISIAALPPAQAGHDNYTLAAAAGDYNRHGLHYTHGRYRHAPCCRGYHYRHRGHRHGHYVKPWRHDRKHGAHYRHHHRPHTHYRGGNHYRDVRDEYRRGAHRHGAGRVHRGAAGQ